MTTQEALQAAWTATRDYVAAAARDALDDDELDWLEFVQIRAARHALECGWSRQELKAVLIDAVEEAEL